MDGKRKTNRALDSRQAGRDRQHGYAYMGDANPSIDEIYNEGAYEENLLSQGINKAKVWTTDKTKQASQLVKDQAEEEKLVRRQDARTRVRGSFKKNRALSKKLTPAKKLVYTARASAINMSAFTYLTPLYFLQLIFAIIGAVAFGVAGSMGGGSGDGLISQAVGLATQVVSGALSFVGFDLAGITENILMLSIMMCLAIGLFSILILFAHYTIVGRLHPLSGEAAGQKMGFLLLAIIGYCVPLANMFPFIVFWMGAVWLNPR